MINANSSYNEMFNSVAREFVGRVELLSGSTLSKIFTHDGALQSFTIEKSGANDKFFGYGICQKATVKLRDKSRFYRISKGQGLQISHGIKNDYIYTYPVFYVDEVNRDENNNDLTITAYDAIYNASSHKVSELNLPDSYSLEFFVYACASKLGMPVRFENINVALRNTLYTRRANFSGEETLREALDDVAEMFGAIYYLNKDWELTFKKLDIQGGSVLTIDKSKYFSLNAKTAHTLTGITSVTELGNNITSSYGKLDHQYLRENAFLTLRDDAGALLDSILDEVHGLTIYQFECKHRGNFLLEIGDKIGIVTKDNETIYTYALNESITYNGGLSSTLSWEYNANKSETASNPSSLTDVIRKTYARVDMLNNEVILAASNSDRLATQVGELRVSNDSLSATVSQVQTNTDAAIDAMNSNMSSLTERVSAAITPENLTISVEQALANGVDSVSTKTGFTFDSIGLTIEKDGNEMKTRITEDGMTVFRDDTAVLVANNIGVEATNLHATTYLIIGDNSRFEGYSNNTRTGCFWIGE